MSAACWRARKDSVLPTHNTERSMAYGITARVQRAGVREDKDLLLVLNALTPRPRSAAPVNRRERRWLRR